MAALVISYSFELFWSDKFLLLDTSDNTLSSHFKIDCLDVFLILTS